MAKVLIQEGVKKYLEKEENLLISQSKTDTDSFRNSLENQRIKRLRGIPKRIRYFKNSDA